RRPGRRPQGQRLSRRHGHQGRTQSRPLAACSNINPPAWVLFGVTAVVAAVDWTAVARSIRRLEYVAKPAVMVGLIAVALAMHPVSAIERTFFVVALVLGLASDVFLMLPRDMFLLGLVAALVEHLAYIAGFRAREFHFESLAVATVVALLSAGIFLPRILRAVRKAQPRLVAPVIAYVVVFVIMVASAGGTGSLRSEEH